MGETDKQAEKSPAERALAKEALATKAATIGQGPNANGEADAKATAEDFSEGSFTIQGQKKITREAGDESTGKPLPVDVVQQGGGGVVNAATGKPLTAGATPIAKLEK